MEDSGQYRSISVGSVHLDIEIRRQVTLNYHTHHPESFFLCQEFSDPKHQEIHSLIVADCRVPVNVGSEDSPHRLFDCWGVETVLRVGSIQVFVDLGKMFIWKIYLVV